MITRRIFVTLLLCLAAACDRGAQRLQFNAVDVTGSTAYAKDFTLSDHDGKARHLGDFSGKAVVLYFGFTHCPDVCPTGLTKLKQVVNSLGADGERVQVLFVTLDPERDNAAVLKQFVPAFHPSFIGLHGSVEQTKQVAKDFKVFFEKQALDGGDYTIDHTVGALVFDAQGRLRLFVPDKLGAEQIAADLKALLT